MQFLQKQFQERSVQKTYLAIVAGVPDPPEAVIDAPVGRNLLNRIKMSILGAGKSREAKTSYRTISATGRCSLLACDLHTGRTHQIRVHLSSIGHPILGDRKYGSSQSRSLDKEYGIESVCLHAWKLQFQTQSAGAVTVTAPLHFPLQEAIFVMGLSLRV